MGEDEGSEDKAEDRVVGWGKMEDRRVDGTAMCGESYGGRRQESPG